MENKEVWRPPAVIRDVPYWHDGMTPDEYDEERIYFAEHFIDWQYGRYKPLWKQRSENEGTRR